MSRRSRFAIILFIFLTAVGTARAQTESTYSLTPWVGVFFPTSDLMSDQNVLQPGSGLPAVVSMRHQTGFALGLRGTRWFSEKLALELEAAWISSDIRLTGIRVGVDQIDARRSARVINVSATALYEIFRPPFSTFAIHALGGVGLVFRAGEFFDDGGGFFGEIDGSTDVALVLGGGFRYGLSSLLGLRLELRDHISTYQASIPDQEIDSKLQNDLVLSIGAEFAL